jgi:16S rRNA (adenine(1408)-N(1))-methyltransferase
VLERAACDPATLFVGIDPNHAGLIESSRRAAKLPNALFVLGSLDELPEPFAGTASSLTVLFPWGSLLQAVASGDEGGLRKLAACCRPGATIEVVTAIDAAADAGELARLGLSGFEPDAMLAAWGCAGFDAALEVLPSAHPYQTTWWRKIRRRPARVASRLRAVAPPP